MNGDDNMKLNEKFIERKRSQALRLNEPELREFEQKLRNSYIFKEQQCQIKEKEYQRIRDEVLQRREAEIASIQKQEYEKLNEMRQKEINRTKIEYGHELQLQIDLHKKQEEILKQEALKQKEFNDAIQSSVDEEQLKKINERVRKLNIHHEMELFKHVKEILQKKSKLQDMNEIEAIEKYRKYELQKEQKLIQTLQKKIELKNEIYETIAAKILAQQKESDERQKLIEELQIYEYANKQKYDQDTKSCDSKEQLINVIKAQIAANLLRERKLQNEELQYRDHLENQLKEFNKQENERKILEKLKTYKYASDINSQIEFEKQKLLLEKEASRKESEQLKLMNAQLRTKIEEEKLKLANEYRKNINF